MAAVNGRARAAVGRRRLSWLVFQVRLELVPHSGGEVAGQWQLSEVELMQQWFGESFVCGLKAVRW